MAPGISNSRELEIKWTSQKDKMRIHTVESLPSSASDEVSMRVENEIDIAKTLKKLIDWCLSKGVKRVGLNDMTGVKIARKMSNDKLDVYYDNDEPVWNMENGVNYII